MDRAGHQAAAGRGSDRRGRRADACLRSQDRRPRGEPSLRGRTAGAGDHARRRREGRRRHRERPHDPRHPAASRDRVAACGPRDSRRDLPARPRVRSHQRRARGGRRGALRERPQRGGGHAETPRSAHRRIATARVLRARPRRGGRFDRRRGALGVSRDDPRMGRPGRGARGRGEAAEGRGQGGRGVR